MTSGQISMTLAMGGMSPRPVPEAVARAVQSVEVIAMSSGPSVFRINFNAERSKTLLDDYEIVNDLIMHAFSRVQVTVTIGARASTLVDGFVTHHQLVPGDLRRGGTFTVTGEDVSVAMDRAHHDASYSAMTDAEIIDMVLGRWSSIDLDPVILAPTRTPPSDPARSTMIQSSTDRAFIQYLAKLNGYVFSVRPAPSSRRNTAYWGPSRRATLSQPALLVDLDMATNVTAMSFAYAPTRPTIVVGNAQNPFDDSTVPVTTDGRTRERAFATRPALDPGSPFAASVLYTNAAFDSVRALEDAQAITDRSTDGAVTVTGSVDSLRYGHVLQAPGSVNVVGPGNSYGGTYDVQQVTHHLAPGSYTQNFTLVREGLGSAIRRFSP